MPRSAQCPICRSGKATRCHPIEYHYDNVGLSDVYLSGNGVVVTTCRHCGNVTTEVNDEQQLLQVLGLNLVLGPPGLQGKQLRFLRSLYGLTQADLAQAMGLPRRETIAEWEARQRVFATPNAELTPRLVLLGLFKTHILAGDHCFLTAKHRRKYDAFVHSIVDHLPHLLKSTTTPQRLSILRSSSRAEWDTEPAAV